MMRIRFRERGLAGHLYTARDQLRVGADQLAVVCPGLPYVPAEEYVTSVLLRRGYDVVQLQYTGTYDSDGIFSPETAADSVPALTGICATGRVHDPKTGVDVPIRQRVDLVVGHSFGSYMALASIARGVGAPTVLAAAPYFCFGGLGASAGARADLSRHATYIHQALPNSIRMKSVAEWDRFFLTDARAAIEPERLADVTPARIVSVVGEKDPSFDVEVLTGYIDSLSDALRGKRSPIRVEPLIVIPGAGHGLEETISDSLLERVSI